MWHLIPYTVSTVNYEYSQKIKISSPLSPPKYVVMSPDISLCYSANTMWHLIPYTVSTVNYEYSQKIKISSPLSPPKYVVMSQDISLCYSDFVACPVSV